MQIKKLIQGETFDLMPKGYHWAAIPDMDNAYFCSTEGDILSAPNSSSRKWKILRGWVNTSGYKGVKICKNGVQKTITIHRLVSLTFIPNPENKPTINHKSGVKTDNSVGNLEWSTYSENNKHAFDVGLNFRHKGEKSHNAKLTEKEVLSILKDKLSSKEIAKKYNVNGTTIVNIKSGRSWSSFTGIKHKSLKTDKYINQHKS